MMKKVLIANRGEIAVLGVIRERVARDIVEHDPTFMVWM